jgi:hypothetical protein
VNPQEITEELEHPGARNLLDSATLLRLAYDGSDGFPRVIPIGFYWNGNQIVVCTAATAPKVKALSSRPNVAMTIDAGDTPTEAKALLVRGLASVDIVDGVPDEYIAASTKALGADQVTEFERQVRSMYDQMARISVEPVWARFFDFGAGRMPSFLTKLAGGAYKPSSPSSCHHQAVPRSASSIAPEQDDFRPEFEVGEGDRGRAKQLVT